MIRWTGDSAPRSPGQILKELLSTVTFQMTGLHRCLCHDAAPSDVPSKRVPKQTTPKGQEIPVPKRGDVFGAFRKIAKADKPTKSGGVGGTEKQKFELRGAFHLTVVVPPHVLVQVSCSHFAETA